MEDHPKAHPKDKDGSWTLRKLPANVTRVESSPRSGRSGPANRGTSPIPVDNASTAGNRPVVAQGNSRTLDSPLRMAPAPPKRPIAQAAQNQNSQSSSNVNAPQGLKRSANSMAEEKIARNVEDMEDLYSEDENNGAESSRKRTRANNEGEQRIGAHIGTGLAVYATYKNALHIRIHPEELNPEIKAKFEGKLTRVVTIEKVVLDAKILGRSTDELGGMTDDQKKRPLKDFLKSKDAASNATDDAEGMTETDHSARPGIIVGYLPEDKDPKLNNVRVPVLAFLTVALALKYRLKEEEAMQSEIELKHRKHPTQNQIVFIPDYKGSVKEIREAIKKDLKKKFPLYREKGGDNGSQNSSSSGEVDPDTLIVDAPPIGTDLKAINARDNVPGENEDSVRLVLRRAVAAHLASGDVLSAEIKKFADARAATIERLEGENEAQDTAINRQTSEITEKAHKIQGLKTVVSDQKTEIARLKEKVNDLTAEVQRLRKTAPATPQNDKLVINGQIFTKFPEGHVNEGLYVSNHGRLVSVGDNDYIENIALSEFRNVELGGVLTQSLALDGVPFKRISGGTNDNKLVQELGPHSIFEHDGKHYMRWFIRTEKTLGL